MRLVITIILAILIVAVLLVIFGWQMVERHTFSEFFVGQVVGYQKAKIPGFIQYVFVYKKRGSPNTVYSRLIWHKTKLKTGGLYRIQVFRRKLPKLGSTTWAIPATSQKLK